MNRHSALRSRPGLRRLGSAAAVVAVHVLAFMALLTARQTYDTAPRKPDTPTLTWMTLAPSAPEPAPVNPPAEANTRILTPGAGISLPPPAAVQPPVTQDPAAAALGEYLSCGLKDDGRLWMEDKKRCEDIHWSVYKERVPPRAPTEQEERLVQKFEHDKAVQNTAVLVPCFSPSIIGVNPICLVSGLINGFDLGNAVYPTGPKAPTHREVMSRYMLPDDIRGRQLAR